MQIHVDTLWPDRFSSSLFINLGWGSCMNSTKWLKRKTNWCCIRKFIKYINAFNPMSMYFYRRILLKVKQHPHTEKWGFCSLHQWSIKESSTWPPRISWSQLPRKCHGVGLVLICLVIIVSQKTKCMIWHRY